MTETQKKNRSGWKQNPEAVKEDILRVATEEFAEQGFSGARVNLIAERTQTSKRMLYYYFGDKEGLYREVLARAYRSTRAGEQNLDLSDCSALEAIKRLVEYTFTHHRNHPSFIRLVMIENIHGGQNLPAREEFEKINAPAIERLREVYLRGVASGEFRDDLDPLLLHWQISALCLFNVSNRITFSHAFGDRLFTEPEQAHLLAEIQRSIIGLLKPSNRA